MRLILLLCAMVLSACTFKTVPVEQVQRIAVENKRSSAIKSASSPSSKTELYVCKGNKPLKVVRVKADRKAARIAYVIVDFNGRSYKLSPILSKNGKKFSNIRWVWWERFDGNFLLFDNSNRVLAQQCKQK